MAIFPLLTDDPLTDSLTYSLFGERYPQNVMSTESENNETQPSVVAPFPMPSSPDSPLIPAFSIALALVQRIFSSVRSCIFALGILNSDKFTFGSSVG